jgi:hypothetical protein
MFAQIVRAKVSDPDAVRSALARWVDDLAPDAKGWVGETSGVTDDGQLFVMAQFDSEGSARFNSARREQDSWWSEFSELLEGEATFRDSNNVLIQTTGNMDSAGFVQVIAGRTRDLERSRQIMTELSAIQDSARPEILGTVSVGHEDGLFTHVLFFTSEADARLGESQEAPPDAKALMDEMMALGVGMPEFLDIRSPSIHSPR